MSAPIWPYQTTGESYRPPIIFLHGFMGSGSDWLPIATELADRFYCILPDLPGHGWNTELSPAQPVNVDSVTDGLQQLIDQLDLAPANLVGYSMGGRSALYAALRFPKRIRTLVLEGANPGLADEQARRARAALDDQRAERLRSAGIDAFVEAWYEMELFRTLHTNPSQLNKTKAERKKNDPRWSAKVIAELSPGRQPPLWDRLADLSMPVLLLAGALDPKYTAIVAEMAANIPQARVEIVPGAGHNVHLEQPEIFLHHLEQFLRR